MGIINKEKFIENEISNKLEEFESLLKLHNAIRSLIDMVKEDEILETFYKEALDNDKVSALMKCTYRPDFKYHEPEVQLLKDMIYIMKKTIRDKEFINSRDQTKYLFHVGGINHDGHSFVSQCVSEDMCNAIQMYTKRDCIVNTINKVTQVNSYERCYIMDFKIFSEGLN